jgi:AraC-like DNA-binding protein
MHEATRVVRTGAPGYLRKRLPQLSLGTDLGPDFSEVIERLEFWIGRGPEQRVTRCGAVAIRRRMAGHVGVVSQRAAAIRTSAHPDRMGHRYFKPVAGSDFPSSCVRIRLSPARKLVIGCQCHLGLEGSLQYQKHLRLRWARRLLLSQDIDVATAALRVGYPVASVQRSRATKPLPKEGLRPRGAATFGTPQVSRAASRA